MGRPLRDEGALGLGLLALTLGVVLLPALTGTAPSASLSLGLVAAALVAFAACLPGLGALGHVAPSRVRRGASDLRAVRVGQVTDPVHHPLRPRAPGTV